MEQSPELGQPQQTAAGFGEPGPAPQQGQQEGAGGGGVPPGVSPGAPTNAVLLAVEGGQLRVLAPPGATDRAVVEPGPNVTVLVNGQPISGPVPVSASDEVAVEPVHQAPVCQVRVKLADDLLKAWAVVERKLGMRFRVQDAPPSRRLVVRAQPLEPIPPPELTEQQVKEAVEAAGVRFGLLDDYVQRVLQARPGEPVLIAQGIAPQKPQDARIEVRFQERVPVRPNPQAQRIDLFERGTITWVQPGEVLAVLHPAIPGQPGTNVLGQPIPVGQPQRVVLRAGKGAALSEDGLEAVATQPGRPVLTGNTVSVVPVYEVPQNADARGGHIRFSGDVHVRGDVLDGVEVVAGGEVRVGGLVSHATIRAGGTVRVGRTIVASKVEAGGGLTTGQEVVPVLAALVTELGQLVEAASQIRTQLEGRHEAAPAGGAQPSAAYAAAAAAAEPGRGGSAMVGELVKRLIERKFWQIPRYARQLRSCAKALESVPDALELAEQAARLLVGSGPLRLGSWAELQALYDGLQGVQEQLLAQQRDHADVVAYAVQNSTVEASGRIVLHGSGAFTSVLRAGKGLEAVRGVVRGGEVTVGEGNVTVKELGGPTGVTTTVTLLRRGRVVAQLVYPHVTVSIAGQKHTFGDGARMVRAYVDPQGQLAVEQLKLDPGQWSRSRRTGDEEEDDGTGSATSRQRPPGR